MNIPSKALLFALFAVSIYSGASHAESYDPYSDDYVLSKDRKPTEFEGPRTYIAGQIGYNSPTGNTRELDGGTAYSAALGYRAYPFVRLEGEVSYHRNSYSETFGGISENEDLDNVGFLVNLFYDFKNSTKLTPYIGAGAGLSYMSLKGNINDGVNNVDIDDSDAVFLYQVGGGFAYEVSSAIALTIDYRYLDSGNAKFEATASGMSLGQVDMGDSRAHEVKAGIRYSF